jgi:DEAD/DEAH box helicase domain-containing protein
MVLQDEPGKDGGPRKHYVMLYDSVPGGTGYLHQLLAHDAKNPGGCAAHGARCADCLRVQPGPGEGRLLPLPLPVPPGPEHGAGVTRQRQGGAHGLVGSLPSLERVKTISDIYINPNFDSVLEARFVESLKKLNGVGGLPAVKLVQDVVHGKSGYVLEVGSSALPHRAQV